MLSLETVHPTGQAKQEPFPQIIFAIQRFWVKLYPNKQLVHINEEFDKQVAQGGTQFGEQVKFDVKK